MTRTTLNASTLKSLEQNARPALAPCLCGCGNTTKGRFFPGHDATLKSALTTTVKSGSPAAKVRAARVLVAFGW